ncbi:hypothetical protein I302_102505 [Kwoniella bestiolae CBS 10118]|uniref:Cupin domain-containing protein n=1 Tax=Kwoniella bestiolae CBS 10118 TaxID=1296100 RepID=A0A1B9GF53_9TREE|nr:cupin domain-containing protein [Kwoniella bestiolae CBS 10118]OCF29684.1 cupin domain-containing protein [Kwoniella bestiolae CBS 10118]
MSPLTPNPLSTLKISKYHIPAYQNFPNTSLRPYPLMIYHSAYPSSLSASTVEQHLSSVGVVQPAWRYTMYKQHHYHSTVDEVLVVVNGAAKLCFGGSVSNPDKVEAEVSKGDVMVVPAGVGHALIEDKGSFEMVGCYPEGSGNWDMCTGEDGEKDKNRKTIRELGWLKGDPMYRDQGPVVDVRE